MNCSKCYAQYEENAQFCPSCGTKTIYNSSLHKANPNVVAVWLYASYLIFTSIMFRVVSLIANQLYKQYDVSNTAKRISSLYALAGFISIFLEIGICVYIIVTVKNTSARIAVGVVAAVSFLIYLVDVVQRLESLV